MSRGPEDQFLTAVIHLCRLRHLFVAHFRPAMSQTGRWVTAVQGDGKGYPDLTIVGPGGQMWRELKSPEGRLSPEQLEWLSRLEQSGADVGVWRPADLTDGRIDAELRVLCRPRSAVAV